MVAQDLPDWVIPSTPATIVGQLDDLDASLVASSSGATVLISAVASKQIVVRALFVTANAAVNFKFQSATTPTDLTGLTYADEKGGLVLPYIANGWFRTISGQALQINLSGAVPVGGAIVYGLV